VVVDEEVEEEDEVDVEEEDDEDEDEEDDESLEAGVDSDFFGVAASEPAGFSAPPLAERESLR
jgi:hypothetical protein